MQDCENDGAEADATGIDQELEAIAGVEGVPQAAVRPLGALVHAVRKKLASRETEAQRASAWAAANRKLRALIGAWEVDDEAPAAALRHARAFVDVDPPVRPPRVERIELVDPAIAILKACGCSLNDAAEVTRSLYPLVGWTKVERKSVIDVFYDRGLETLRGPVNAHQDSTRAQYEQLAVLIYDRS